MIVRPLSFNHLSDCTCIIIVQALTFYLNWLKTKRCIGCAAEQRESKRESKIKLNSLEAPCLCIFIQHFVHWNIMNVISYNLTVVLICPMTIMQNAKRNCLMIIVIGFVRCKFHSSNICLPAPYTSQMRRKFRPTRTFSSPQPETENPTLNDKQSQANWKRE